MSTEKPYRHSREEMLQLVTACRSSGLTDAEWCRQNNIKTGKFYNWISILRKDGRYPIPASNNIRKLESSCPQDVVKVDLVSSKPESLHTDKQENESS